MATSQPTSMSTTKTSTLAEDVDKELTCAICLSRYETPKVLPCLHTYCKGCLEDLFKKARGDQVTCPQCKEEHQLPEEGVDGFKTYFTIKNLLELLKVLMCFLTMLGVAFRAFFMQEWLTNVCKSIILLCGNCSFPQGVSIILDCEENIHYQKTSMCCTFRV